MNSLQQCGETIGEISRFRSAARVGWIELQELHKTADEKLE